MPNLLLMFLQFFCYGSITYGGGMMVVPLIYDNLGSYGSLTEEVFLKIVGISNFIPGPIGINITYMVATLEASFLGGVLVVFAFIIPGVFSTYIFIRFNNKYNFLSESSTLYLMLIPMISVFFLRSSFLLFQSGETLWKSLLIFFLAFIMVKSKKVNYIFIIIGCGILSMFI